jgi:hypothetical protein
MKIKSRKLGGEGSGGGGGRREIEERQPKYLQKK